MDSNGVVFGTSFFNVRLNKPSREGSVIQLKSYNRIFDIYVGRCKKYTEYREKDDVKLMSIGLYQMFRTSLVDEQPKLKVKQLSTHQTFYKALRKLAHQKRKRSVSTNPPSLGLPAAKNGGS